MRDIEAAYNGNSCDCKECKSISEAFKAIDLEPYARLIQKIAKDMHDGNLKPEDLNKDLVKQIYKDLSEGAETVYGDKWKKFDVKEPQSLQQKFKKNLWQFSSAKTYTQLQEMNNNLLDKGRIRLFPEFLQQARKTNQKFNENYIQAEHQTAIKGCQAAEQWKIFMKDADIFPNLEYRTVGDDRVRPEHELLNGIIKPIGDAFWKIYYTPNGWRCRCYIIQTAAKATPGKFDDESVLPEFRGNVALDEEIFTKKGGFFKLLNMDHKAKVNAEYMKLNAPYDEAYTAQNGKKVYANIFADESDKVKNVETGMIIAEKLDKDVFVRPHIDVQNHKNPEYLIDGKLADRKEQRGKNISSNLNSAKRQGCKTVVFDITEDFRQSIEFFKNQLRGHLKAHYKGAFEEIIIITGNKAETIKVRDLIK